MMVRRQNWLHRCASHTTDPHSPARRTTRDRSFIMGAGVGENRTQARLRNQNANREKAGETPFPRYGFAISVALAESGDARRAGRPRTAAYGARCVDGGLQRPSHARTDDRRQRQRTTRGNGRGR